MENNKRVFKYDFMRIVFMLMVLGIHVLSMIRQFMFPYNTTWYIVTIITDILMIANPLFFMLSGKFNLNKQFTKKEDYKNFYIKRFISIIIPFLLISFMIYFTWNYKAFSLLEYIKNLVSGEIEGTYWFVYALIGILVLSPFFSKMLVNMELFEKKIFLSVLFIINAFISILAIFNIQNAFTFTVVGLAGWHFYYFAGYMIEDIFKSKKSRNILIILGIIALVLQFLIRRFIDFGYRLTDPSPLLTLQAFGLYFLLLDKVKIKKEEVQKIISNIAKYSFSFYLIHMLVVKKISGLFILDISSIHNFVCGIFIFIISFVITLIISMFIEKIAIKPIKKMLEKKLLKTD